MFDIDDLNCHFSFQAIVMHPIGNSFQLSRQITLWLCRDLLPFNTIAHSGFQDFCVAAKIVKTAGNLPSTRTLALTALDDVYQVTYAKFLKKIKNIPTVISVTFDFWTDNVKRSSYITFTGHWIENFTMVSVVFKTEAFPHPHTGERIQAAFEDLKTEFGLREKTILAVTDGGSNVIKACRLMQIDRMQCIAHGLHNLIIHDLLKNEEMTHVSDVIKKIKKMLMALTYKYDELTKAHSNAIDKKLVDLIDIAVSLQEVFEAEDSVRVHEEDKELFNVLNDRTPFKTLKNSNSTRWNSTLLMLESVLANQDVVSDCLHLIKRYDVMLNAEEMQLAKDITAVLKKFAVATDFFQGQKYPTLNTVLLFLTDLKSSLRNYLNDSSSDVIKKASEILLSGMDKRFPVTETQVVAAFLDPSMQNLAAINTYLSEKQQSMAEILENLWQKFDLKEPPDAIVIPSTSVSVKSKAEHSKQVKLRLSMLELHGHGSQTTEENRLLAEITRYKKTVSEIVEDPLLWWQKQTSEYPQLAVLASVYLSIPATSAPSERVFSGAGLLLTAKRSRLHPLKAKKFLFIHDNFDFIQH